MKNCKEKFDERMRENFGKEKSESIWSVTDLEKLIGV